ncbi:MAG: hypothetical protein SOX86_00020 [Bacilli bacterium]|nr:hypothetical protein [Bacilli bacterium]
MNDKIKEILEMITNKGFKAYVVGGYVRDYLRKIKSIDVDICTNARVKDLMEIFKDYKITSLEYGNILLETKDYLFEITTFRKDIDYINNRKPIIEYVDTLEEDITRRDFTVNSICMDKDGKIIDLLNGKKDLNKKIIRTIGDPYFKIKQDSLRILRAIRFASCLNFKIEDNLKKAIKENKDLLKDLSYERKKEELTKIFTSDNKAYGVKLLKELDLLDVLELTNIDNVLRTKDLIGMWSTITINDNYPFTKKEKDLINNINKLLKEDLNDIFVLYKTGLYEINIVCDLKKLSKKKYSNKYEKLVIKDKNEIDITTEDICILLNKEPGCFLKEIYNDLEKNILLKNVKNNKEEIEKYILNNYK